jgi:hypothetical protein
VPVLLVEKSELRVVRAGGDQSLAGSFFPDKRGYFDSFSPRRTRKTRREV